MSQQDEYSIPIPNIPGVNGIPDKPDMLVPEISKIDLNFGTGGPAVSPVRNDISSDDIDDIIASQTPVVPIAPVMEQPVVPNIPVVPINSQPPTEMIVPKIINEPNINKIEEHHQVIDTRIIETNDKIIEEKIVESTDKIIEKDHVEEHVSPRMETKRSEPKEDKKIYLEPEPEEEEEPEEEPKETMSVEDFDLGSLNSNLNNIRLNAKGRIKGLISKQNTLDGRIRLIEKFILLDEKDLAVQISKSNPNYQRISQIQKSITSRTELLSQIFDISLKFEDSIHKWNKTLMDIEKDKIAAYQKIKSLNKEVSSMDSDINDVLSNINKLVKDGSNPDLLSKATNDLSIGGYTGKTFNQ